MKASTSSNGEAYVLYRYAPSMVAAIIFTVLFGLTTAAHLFQLIKNRTWFMVPFFVGGVFETLGYVGRNLSAHENPGPYSLGPFIMQSLLLLVAPALLAASIYMEMSRIVLMVNGEHALFIKRSRLTVTFVCGDIISFLVQLGGGGLMATGDLSTINIGTDLIIVGLFLQITFFALFVIAASIFHFRLSKAPTTECATMPWRKHMLGLYIVSILIFVRSIVRCVEYLEGNAGYVIAHEVFLYIFDSIMILLAMATMNVIHPAEVKRMLLQGRHAGKDHERADESFGLQTR